MTQVEMTKKVINVVDELVPDGVHSEDNTFRDIENTMLGIIALNLAVIADELKKERK